MSDNPNRPSVRTEAMRPELERLIAQNNLIDQQNKRTALRIVVAILAIIVVAIGLFTARYVHEEQKANLIGQHQEKVAEFKHKLEVLQQDLNSCNQKVTQHAAAQAKAVADGRAELQTKINALQAEQLKWDDSLKVERARLTCKLATPDTKEKDCERYQDSLRWFNKKYSN